MALIKDVNSNVVLVDFQGYASRTANGSYTDGDIKNMARKEGGVLVLFDVTSVTTSLLLKFQDCDTVGGTYADVAEGTAAAIPGPGSMGAAGTVASASGVHTVTVAGKFGLYLPSTSYKQFLRLSWQTTGGAAAFSVSGVAVGPELPIAS